MTLAWAISGCGMIRGRDGAGQDAELRDGEGREVSVAERISAAGPELVNHQTFTGTPVDALTASERAMSQGYASDASAAEVAAAPPRIDRRSVLYAIHLASYRTEASATAGWSVLTHEVPGVLEGLHPRVETVDLGPEQGVFLRLKAGPLDSREDAAARCAALSGAGYYCRAVDFEGRDVAN
ncbi:MAG: SPOR domain-containing protein [Maricaulaceae bacterium]